MKIGSISEVLLRLETVSSNNFSEQNIFEFKYVGTGINFLTTINKFNYPVYLISKLPNNKVGKNGTKQLAKYNLNCQKVQFESNNIGIYVLEKGQGSYPNIVTYLNRDNSPFNLTKNFDVSIINDLDIIHFCGISLQTMINHGQAIIELARQARNANKTVIFDFNVRKSLAINLEQIKSQYQQILKYCNIINLSKWDIETILEIKANDLNEGYQKLYQNYPELELITTLNRQENNNISLISSVCQVKGQTIIKSKVNQIENPVDRIGTGDAFLGYLIGSYFKQNKKITQTDLNLAVKYCELSHFKNGDIFDLELEQFNLIINNQTNTIR